MIGGAMAGRGSMSTKFEFVGKPCSDGSGAPALTTVQGWKWACDFLGEVKCRLLTETSSRKPPRWMAEHVRSAYLAALKEQVSAEWFETSKKMYETV